METTIYSLNTGGDCMIFAVFTDKTDETGCSILKVWDNWTGEPAKYVPVSKYAQSFELGEAKFYLSEFTVTKTNYPCTPEQLSKQIQKNIAGLERMRDRAIKTGQKVYGYTAEMLEMAISNYKNIYNL